MDPGRGTRRPKLKLTDGVLSAEHRKSVQAHDSYQRTLCLEASGLQASGFNVQLQVKNRGVGHGSAIRDMPRVPGHRLRAHKLVASTAQYSPSETV